MTTEPNNQELACRRVLDDLSERLGEPINVVGRPDEEERQREAVEILAQSESGSHQFAIEHTRIESFPEQISDGAAFSRVLRPLETELSAELGGHYWLIVPAGASERVRAKDTERVQDTIKKWVIEAARTLEAKDPNSKKTDSITVELDGVAFPLTLKRTRYPGPSFGIFSIVPEELEELRAQRVNSALTRKCLKLERCRQDGYSTVLVLESNDIQLANAGVIKDALTSAQSGREDMPDYVYLVETEIAPPLVHFLRGPRGTIEEH